MVSLPEDYISKLLSNPPILLSLVFHKGITSGNLIICVLLSFLFLNIKSHMRILLRHCCSEYQLSKLKLKQNVHFFMWVVEAMHTVNILGWYLFLYRASSFWNLTFTIVLPYSSVLVMLPMFWTFSTSIIRWSYINCNLLFIQMFTLLFLFLMYPIKDQPFALF